MARKGVEVRDLVILELSNAIQIAKNSTEFYTDDFKNVKVVEKPVEISVESAEFILDCLQRWI
jgi:hypothetical protein